jgi:ubiquinone/menaquinone biosynthesis C-methylase UbiE
MSTQVESVADQFRALVREEWTDAQTVDAWRRWHPKILAQLEEMTEAIVQAARLGPGMQVLDLACGTGDPALALAPRVVPGGHVTATDLSEGMLETATANARREGLGNISFSQADAEELPFDDARFDVVTSRIGAMYFVNIQRALGEMLRVLRPGGRVVLTAWGPLDQNVYAATLLTPFFKRVEVPSPPAGAPQPLRFAQPGSLSAELRQAGFAQVSEEARVIASRWPGPPEEFWQHFYDIAVPFRPIFDGLPPEERAAAIGEVLDGFRHYYDGERVVMPTAIVIASATRSA